MKIFCFTSHVLATYFPYKIKSSFSIAISTVNFITRYVQNHAFQIRMKIKFTEAHGEKRNKDKCKTNISM